VSAYLVAIAVAGGLGAFALAADVYRRYLARRGGRVLDAYTGILLLTLVPGSAALGVGTVVGTPNWWQVVLAVPVGLGVGIGARHVDRAVVRRDARRSIGARRTIVRTADAPGGRVTPTAAALLLGGAVRRDAATSRETPRDAVDPRQFPLGTVLAVAAAEEAFYRGVLLRAALLPHGWVGPALAALSVGAFALAHVTFGWAHVLAKAPLGAGATIVTILLGSPAAAVAGHVWFNLSAWRDMRAAR
jgi:hypothetical protein